MNKPEPQPFYNWPEVEEYMREVHGFSAEIEEFKDYVREAYTCFSNGYLHTIDQWSVDNREDYPTSDGVHSFQLNLLELFGSPGIQGKKILHLQYEW